MKTVLEHVCLLLRLLRIVPRCCNGLHLLSTILGSHESLTNLLGTFDQG